MKGLDTNVLLAWLLDERSTLLQPNETYRIGAVVVAELVWVLDRTLRLSRREIASIVSRIVATPQLRLFDRKIVTEALASFEKGPADFADYLVAHENAGAGCATTLTLDRKAAKHAEFTMAK